MTRREEINQQAEECRQLYRDGGYRLSSKDVRDAFEEGAEWADKTMIDKVEKYLRAKIILYTFATTVDQREEWFNDFRKVMEG